MTLIETEGSIYLLSGLFRRHFLLVFVYVTAVDDGLLVGRLLAACSVVVLISKR